MLFGESTPKSVRYRVWIDGKLVEHREGGANSPLLEEFDAGKFGRRAGGNVHHVQVIATGLDPLKPHTFELEPIFDAPGQELRLESKDLTRYAEPSVGVQVYWKRLPAEFAALLRLFITVRPD